MVGQPRSLGGSAEKKHKDLLLVLFLFIEMIKTTQTKVTRFSKFEKWIAPEAQPNPENSAGGLAGMI
ncbi:hypothetical protein [Tumebacillus lipolyticus]|uniref:Uncharacterized protein n=1 Tax=Tumebacillus lipolyticus TaxID=1280370 RepID=A0ABW4ZZA0_9BACL